MEAGEVDACMKLGAGHPMGPLALLDFVGLDVAEAIGDALYADSARAAHKPPGPAGRDGRRGQAGPQERRRLLQLRLGAGQRARIAVGVALLRALAGLATARGLDLEVLGQAPAVLGGVADLRDRPVGAEVPGVGEIAVLTAEDVEVEVADRGVGDDRDGRPQAAR